MSAETDTPRTDAEIDDARNVALEYECSPQPDSTKCEVVPADFARQLERELNEARSDILAAAGELRVPIPPSGSPMAKSLAANAIMRQQRDEARAEILTMRDIFPAILKACGNGSECSPDASVEFLAHVPNEVGAVICGLKQQRDRLADALREFIGLDDNPPLARHGKRWAETWRKARAALAEITGKEAANG